MRNLDWEFQYSAAVGLSHYVFKSGRVINYNANYMANVIDERHIIFYNHWFTFKKNQRICQEAGTIADLLRICDNLAERSKAPASGAGPKGRGFKSHSCHI